jgi:bacterial/archaeal transporter family protein
MWMFYAFLSAVAAALVAIFGKLGLKDIDPTLATTIRAVVMTLFLICVSLMLRKFDGFSFSSLEGRDWMLIVLAGIAGAVSWLFYFVALKSGVASGVVAIDRLSIVFVVFLAAVFLGETLGVKSILGAALIALGAFLITYK